MPLPKEQQSTDEDTPKIRVYDIMLENSQDKMTKVTRDDKTSTGEDLKDSHPSKVPKTLANARYVYYNDGTVNGLINNNAITANHKWKIKIRKGFDDKKNIEEARTHIENRCKPKDWNLDNVITQSLIKAQRDGKCFINVPVVESSVYLSPLTYDAEKYDMLIVPNTSTGKIEGFVQKSPAKPDYKGWDKSDYNDLSKEADKDGEDTTTPYMADEMIYFTLLEEDNEGESVLFTILDLISDKWDYEGFKISIARNSGSIAVIKVGSDSKSDDKVQQSYITKLLDAFLGRVKKSAVVVGDSVEVQEMKNQQLADIPHYRKDLIDEIYLVLQTPISFFNPNESSYAANKVATDRETGYGVWLEFMRDKVKAKFEGGLFDRELALINDYKDCIGGIEISFADDVELEMKEPINEDYNSNNPDLENKTEIGSE